MQLTIDISDELYRKLEAQSKQRNVSIEDIVVGGTQIAVREPRSERALGELAQMNVNFNDFMFMTDDEYELFNRIAALDAEAAVQAFSIRRLDDAA